MRERSVGVLQLKTQLSEYLRQVKHGQTIMITEYGKPIRRIVPATQPLEYRLQAMPEAGLIIWSGKRLRPHAAKARTRGKHTVADMLIENRE